MFWLRNKFLNFCYALLTEVLKLYAFLSSAAISFLKINVFKNDFRNNIRVSNSLDPDPVVLVPNGLQHLSIQNVNCTTRNKVCISYKYMYVFY